MARQPESALTDEGDDCVINALWQIRRLPAARTPLGQQVDDFDILVGEVVGPGGVDAAGDQRLVHCQKETQSQQ